MVNYKYQKEVTVLGYKIKEARVAKDMSQQELAEKANVSRTIISQLESGTRTVTKTDTLIKIANALDVKVEDIFFT